MGRDHAGNVRTDTKIILKEIIHKYDETMRSKQLMTTVQWKMFMNNVMTEE
jgi:hypothetical protein